MKKSKIYKDKIAKAMMEEFKYTNIMQVPKLEKICINAGIGDATTDTKIIEQSAKEIEQITGQSIRKLVNESAHGNLVSGFINGLTFGIAGDKSSSKLQDKMLHSKETTGAKVVRTVGNVAGGAATGAAIGAGIGVWFGGVGAGPGAVIGAGVGAVCGFISKLWS